MNNWAIILPIASGLLIYGLRMAELGTKREIVPGPVRETATLRLFILAGALIEKFGDAYRAYQSNTPALFPYKWPTIK